MHFSSHNPIQCSSAGSDATVPRYGRPGLRSPYAPIAIPARAARGRYGAPCYPAPRRGDLDSTSRSTRVERTGRMRGCDGLCDCTTRIKSVVFASLLLRAVASGQPSRAHTRVAGQPPPVPPAPPDACPLYHTGRKQYDPSGPILMPDGTWVRHLSLSFRMRAVWPPPPLSLVGRCVCTGV